VAETLQVGDRVIDFSLRGADGNTYNTAEARRNGLLMFVFWKKTCGTCQFSFPYLQRFHEQYAHEKFRVWGVAQENQEDVIEFVGKYSATFPQLLDEHLDATELYKPTHVPALYLVDQGDTILRFAPAFMKDEYYSIARLISERTGVPYSPIVRQEDGAPDLKPG
jgi:peroxiredoxin